jgi:hypothetical protein
VAALLGDPAVVEHHDLVNHAVCSSAVRKASPIVTGTKKK